MITRSPTDDYSFEGLGPSGPFLVFTTKLRFISAGIIREIVAQSVSLRCKPVPIHFSGADVCAAEYYRLVSKPRKSTDATSRNCWATQHRQDYAFQRGDGTDVGRHGKLHDISAGDEDAVELGTGAGRRQIDKI